MKQKKLISLHGGHSGEFCSHAQDTLEQIITAYITRGFTMVGISEHIPPLDYNLLLPEEKKAGLTPVSMAARFNLYMSVLEGLQKKYHSRIKIFKGFESEAWSGYENQVNTLIKTFKPDYIVGSIHHVNDRCFDYSAEEYKSIAKECGGISRLYQRYFDEQYEMISKLNPFIVGHFDLIRIYDPLYKKRIMEPIIQNKIQRNLELIKTRGLTMDFNLRPLIRGEKEAYPTHSILQQTKKAQIPMMPGDDSHSAAQAGIHVSEGINLLESMGFDTKWPLEKMLMHQYKIITSSHES